MSEEKDKIAAGQLANAFDTDPEKPLPVFKCEFEGCGKVFKNPLGLKIHANTHKPRKKLFSHRKKAAPIKTAPPAYPRDALKTEAQVKNPNEPWRPASVLSSNKIPGMRPRWIRKDLLEKRVEEGWQPRLSDSKNRVESPEKTIVDGIPLGRYVTKRNLVLCDMPEEMALSRATYFRQLNDANLKGMKQKFASEAGGETYGEIKVERG